MLEKVGSAMKPLRPAKEDRSALSARTMNQIAQARDAVWQSNRAGILAAPEQSAQPRVEIIDKSEIGELPRSEPAYIEPMQAKLVDQLPQGESWAYEAFLRKHSKYGWGHAPDGEIFVASPHNTD
jgi:hypothetical protein